MIPLHALGTVDSTSREAARWAARGETGPIWIWAKTQTAGRGRAGRDWISPDGNLFATLLMPVEDDPPQIALRSFVACLAVADTLDTLTQQPARVSLKWPNDALLDSCKVAGVLLETGGVDTKRWLTVGIGINLAHSPETERWPTISVAKVVDKAPTPEAVLPMLRDSFAARETEFQRYGFAAIRTAWLARAARIGDKIEARLPNETCAGIFETVDSDGALMLRTSEGIRRIMAADIHFGP